MLERLTLTIKTLKSNENNCNLSRQLVYFFGGGGVFPFQLYNSFIDGGPLQHGMVVAKVGVCGICVIAEAFQKFSVFYS